MSRSRFLASSRWTLTSAAKPSLRPSQTCQMNGRWWKRLQCCSKNWSRSQVSRDLPAQSASASSWSRMDGFPTAGLDGFPGVDQQRQQALVGGLFTTHRRQTGDAVIINMMGEHFTTGDPGAGFVGQLHLIIAFSGPAIAQQAGDSDLQRVGRGLRVTVKDPLGRVVGVGLRQAVGVAFGGDLLPVGEVEGNFDEGGVGDI